jgi:hypothetical protein
VRPESGYVEQRHKSAQEDGATLNFPTNELERNHPLLSRLSRSKIFAPKTNGATMMQNDARIMKVLISPGTDVDQSGADDYKSLRF